MDTTFAQTVVTARHDAGLTRHQLARRLAAFGLPSNENGVRELELGLRPVGLAEAVALGEILAFELPRAADAERVTQAASAFASYLGDATADAHRVERELSRLSVEITAELRQLLARRTQYLAVLETIGVEPDQALTARAKALTDMGLMAKTTLTELVEAWADATGSGDASADR